MYGWMARWLVSRSIDEDRAIPSWVARRMKRDETLQQFELRCRQVVQQLRDDAPQWAARRDVQQWLHASTCRPGRSYWTRALAGWTAAAVATVLFVLIVTLWPNRNEMGDTPRPDLAHGSQELPSLDLQPFRDRMLDGVLGGRQMIERLTDDMRQLSDTVVLPQPSQAIALSARHARDAGTLFGRSLAILDRAAREQRNNSELLNNQ